MGRLGLGMVVFSELVLGCSCSAARFVSSSTPIRMAIQRYSLADPLSLDDLNPSTCWNQQYCFICSCSNAFLLHWKYPTVGAVLVAWYQQGTVLILCSLFLNNIKIPHYEAVSCFKWIRGWMAILLTYAILWHLLFNTTAAQRSKFSLQVTFSCCFRT